MADERKPKLIALPERREGELLAPASGSALRPRDLRRRILAASFAICVLVPSLLGAVYYAFVASDRYVAGAGFAVRGMDGGAGADLLGSFTGLASNGSTTSDSYILLKYLESRDIVENLQEDFPFRQSYGTGDADFLARLAPDLEIEQVVEYWQSRIHTAFDSTSGIITFKVEAFTPQDAERIAALVLDYSKELVNELSSQARDDAVAYANMEVERAELRLKAALDSLRRFREDERALDPASSARIQLELIGTLEKQLAEYRARIAALEETVDASSPSLRNLIRQAEALEAQIAVQRSETSSPNEASGAALTGQLATYETLEVERNFAQQAYTSALSSLEKARVEADRQQRYLAVYSTPAVPQYPLYPRRILNTFLIFAGLSLVWGIGTLIVYAVRDHVS